MPNVKGGKGYKKGKNSSEADEKMIEWNSADGQMLGRVVATLGSRRFRVYCNDNTIRVCRIVGSMRKSDWITKGAIVLIALRNLTSRTTGSDDDELGDIMHLFGSHFYKDLKVMPGTNPAMFTLIENKSDDDMIKLMKDVTRNVLNPDEDDFFLQEGEEDGEDGEVEAVKNVKLALEAEAQSVALKEKVKKRDIEIKAKREEREIRFDDL